MPKLVNKKPVTLEHLSGTLDHLSNLVEKGFLSVRSELSQKADKADIVNLRTELNGNINELAMANKLGFDELHRELGLKADKADLETGLDDVKHRLNNLDNRLDIFATHEKRLVKVERELGFAV